jgi:polysaccharide pyruvyl transferase WcaK-like protein
MRIVIDPGTFDCLNMGDVAMLQVAVRRLRRLWPSAAVAVFTSGAESLSAQVEGVLPLDHNGRLVWFSDFALIGGLKGNLPAPISSRLGRLTRLMRQRNPQLLKALLRVKAQIGGADGRAAAAFLEAIASADLYVVSGAITLTDKSAGHGRTVLDSLDLAISQGVPAVMFGQGIGPLHDDDLIAKAKAVLPRVNVIALREARTGPRLLEKLGVDSGRVFVTGDDAIELAYERRAASPGHDIGVNLRIGRSSDVPEELADAIGPALHQCAREKSAALLPLPIAHHAASDDPRAIKRLLAGYDDRSDGGRSLNTPEKLIEEAGRCRVVVTGAYHAAVFALSQGVPAICLAYNAYYSEKFLGLSDLFGAGCEVVFIGGAGLREKLAAALDRAWDRAEAVRKCLLAAAARQVSSSRMAYERAAEEFENQREQVA